MTDTLRHRGPDDSGIWVDQAMGVALGHRRLSILDVSSSGHQPMVSKNGRYVLLFNGEIYNHLELRRELGDIPALHHQKSGNFHWHGHSDTESLLACLSCWGVERTLEKVTGMFAFGLWDRHTRQLTLARDRMGEKPLYYGWHRGTFLFGSELRAFKAHPDFQAEVDRGSLALMLRRNYVPAPYSIYKGIYKLPPGTFIQVRNLEEGASPTTYWSLRAVSECSVGRPFKGADEEAIDETERHLGAAVGIQMVADVPVGTLLSGGIDSSLITAIMQAQSNRAVRTFTIGFHEREYNESVYAREVAKHLGTDHTSLYVSGHDVIDLVPQMPEIYDEPFADSSQLPTYLVMKLAAENVKVVLSGDASDESFGGYNRYIYAPRLWERIGWMPEGIRSSLGSGLAALPIELVDQVIGPLARRIGIAQTGNKIHSLGLRMKGLGSVDDLYTALVSGWPEASSVVLGEHRLTDLVDQRENWPDLSDPVSRMMSLDGLTYLPDDILVKVDRAAMAVSLETRAPYLDHRVIEFAWTLPMHMKIRNGQGKWLLRNLLYKYVPNELVDRPKLGFGVPLDAWLRGPLRDWAEHLLEEGRLRREGYFEPLQVRAAWEAHLKGSVSNSRCLWSILMFQAWLETN